jgi:putative nucleotidyltransferase with HDIG domain
MGQSGHSSYDHLTPHIPAKELSTLLKVSSSLTSTLELKEVLQIAIESAVDLLGVDTGAIYTLEREQLSLGATVPPLPPDFPDELLLAAVENHPHIKAAVLTKAPVYLKDASLAPLSDAEKIVVQSRNLVSVLFFPLLLKNDSIGAFIVGTTGGVCEFSDTEIDLCYIFSYQVSLAIANALLYKRSQEAIVELTRAYDATLEGWSRVLDMRDHVTDEHTQRVADLTVALASRMSVPADELDNIRRGALLHDIGKMGIPDYILQNPEALTDEELQIMRTHPEKAYQLISQIDYLATAVDIPYCHHEKWDGTGYPRNLKGEEIPFAARIFAVVDVYDALTTDRPYQKAWTQSDALKYLQAQSGEHFYPQAVKKFVEMLTEQDNSEKE